jgi:UDP-3-O-[3-hydroxymyristoyl] glucosamine N-acyltransferase
MKKFTLEALAELTNSSFVGNKNYLITGVNTLDQATNTDVSFLSNLRYAESMISSKAGVICISSQMKIKDEKNYLISSDPSKTFQEIVEIIMPSTKKTGFKEKHSSAIIHETAKIGENVVICPYAVIDENTVIENDTFIGPFVFVGPNTYIGKKCVLHSHSVVRENCIIGNNVTLQPGAIIGSCGFGYIQDKKGNHLKLEQVGNVILEDDVEIGANTTIDRARFKETIIRKGTKIDNLVQIAHNTEIGANNIIAAQTGIAGSSKTGKNVMMGGQVGVLGHVTISEYSLIATRSGVSKSLKNPGKYRGSPAIEINEYNRQQVHFRRLKNYANSLKILEEKVKILEEKLQEDK